MKDRIDARICALADYILENEATVRAAAARYGVSKSTVHKDVTQRLRLVDHARFLRVQAVLARNKAERHLRGGMATKRKYELLSQRAEKE